MKVTDSHKHTKKTCLKYLKCAKEKQLGFDDTIRGDVLDGTGQESPPPSAQLKQVSNVLHAASDPQFVL